MRVRTVKSLPKGSYVAPLWVCYGSLVRDSSILLKKEIHRRVWVGLRGLEKTGVPMICPKAPERLFQGGPALLNPCGAFKSSGVHLKDLYNPILEVSSLMLV